MNKRQRKKQAKRLAELREALRAWSTRPAVLSAFERLIFRSGPRSKDLRSPQ